MDFSIGCFDRMASEIAAKMPNVRERPNHLLLMAANQVSNETRTSQTLIPFYSGSKPAHLFSYLFIKPRTFLTQLSMPLPLG